jgi:hypothetical protein
MRGIPRQRQKTCRRELVHGVPPEAAARRHNSTSPLRAARATRAEDSGVMSRDETFALLVSNSAARNPALS